MKPLVFLSLLTALVLSPLAQARVGGGRSFGSRGSRAVSPHYSPPVRSTSPYSAPRSVPPPAQAPLEPRFGSGGGGSFMRGMAGGLAGGMIGSWLFGRHGGGGYDGGGYGGGGGGGFGFLELLLLAGLAFLAFRWFRRQQYAGGPQGTMYSAPTPVYSAPNDEPTVVADFPQDTLARYESNFTLEAFQEARTDDFFRIQAAFMARDLSSARTLLQPELEHDIESDLAQLRSSGKINRLENITVRQTDVTEAWQEEGKLYATVHFKANLLDYMVDEKSGEVVSGSRTEPVKFDEYWTFVRSLATDGWRLSAIEQA